MILIIFIIIIILLALYNVYTSNINEKFNENFNNDVPVSNEAIKNISSVFNKDNMTVTNIETTGTLTTKDSTMNDIKLTKGWSGYPDSANDRSEISNDTNVHKTLMIAGNKSNGNNQRNVGIWDNLNVSNSLTAKDSTLNDIKIAEPNLIIISVALLAATSDKSRAVALKSNCMNIR